MKSAIGFKVSRFQGFKVLGFKVLGFKVLGFKVLGFKVLGFKVLGFRVFRVSYVSRLLTFQSFNPVNRRNNSRNLETAKL